MKRALIVIDVQKYFLNEETTAIVKGIQEHLEKNDDQYQAIYFTIFKNDASSPFWKISDWQDCKISPDIDIYAGKGWYLLKFILPCIISTFRNITLIYIM